MNNKAVPLIDRALRGVAKSGAGLGTVLVYVAAAAVLFDITSRFFAKAVYGIYEALSISVVVLMFYGLPQVILENKDIRIDTFANKLKGKGRSVLEAAYRLLAVFIYGVLTYYCWRETAISLRLHESFGQTAHIPFVIPWTLISVVLTMCFVVSTRLGVAALRECFSPPRRSQESH